MATPLERFMLKVAPHQRRVLVGFGEAKSDQGQGMGSFGYAAKRCWHISRKGWR